MNASRSILLLSAACCALASAQVYTNPVGYNTQTLAQGYNCVGLTLHSTTAFTGTIDSVSGNVITDAALSSFTPQNGRTYVVEITASATPSLVGVIQDVLASSITTSTITTTDTLTNLAAGDTYSIRLAPTLEEVFTTVSLSSGGVLQAALNSGSADIVWVPQGNGSYIQYYLHNTGAFRNVATNTASPNVPLIYADGLLVQKKSAGAASLTVSGEVKMIGTNSVAIQGYNLLSIVCPAGKNLWNVGLEDDIQAALNTGSADIVWVQQSNLSYKQYFRHNSGNWRDVANSTVNLTQAECEAVTLPTCILIQRKSAIPATIDLTGPQ